MYMCSYPVGLCRVYTYHDVEVYVESHMHVFGCVRGKLCMALLEKAFAKLYGSYSALNAGFQPVAWHHLTGCKEFFRYKSSYKVAVRWVVDAHGGIEVYSEKRKGKKLGVLKQGSYFHEKQRIGRWIQHLGGLSMLFGLILNVWNA